MRSGKRTQWWVTASLKTIIVTHCRFFHCYYLQERKCPRNFIILISFFERYRKLPFASTQHHCLFINFGGGKERGSRQKIVKSKKYYKSSHCLIIKSHLFIVLFFIWHQEVSPNQEVTLHQNSKYKRDSIPSISTANVKSNDTVSTMQEGNTSEWGQFHMRHLNLYQMKAETMNCWKLLRSCASCPCA